LSKIQTFQEFLASTSVQVPVFYFILNLLIAGLLAVFLGWVYSKYGNTLSNRKLLGRNFLMITMTTMLIIAIVKSSLALSLGLVGALSIVRFRAAIKEPEELSYLFLSIGIGLGFGADQGMITIIAFFIIMVIVVLKKKFSQRNEGNQNLYLTVYSENPKKIELEQIVDTLKTHCLHINLKRFDQSKAMLEASFLVEFRDFNQFKEAKNALQELSDSLKISFMDNKGII
jgi:uncharacterized membrane protein YhiD involved in acid resistance